MDIEAVSQAKAKLAKAKKALVAFKAAAAVEEAEEAWSDYLLAVSTLYSKLEQGAKINGKSHGWFGRKKKERKDDPLLRYLHYARNSDEHGIERVVATTPDNTWQGRTLKFNERIDVKLQMADRVTGQWGPEFDGVLAGPTLKPVRAHDRRYNDYCDPPTTHLGVEILYSDFVDGIGSAAIVYLERMISEAAELASNAIAK